MVNERSTQVSDSASGPTENWVKITLPRYPQLGDFYVPTLTPQPPREDLEKVEAFEEELTEVKSFIETLARTNQIGGFEGAPKGPVTHTLETHKPTGQRRLIRKSFS